MQRNWLHVPKVARTSLAATTLATLASLAALASAAPAPNPPAESPASPGTIAPGKEASELQLHCRPSASDCPVTHSPPGTVVTTDSLPLGSTVKAQREGKATEPSDYPTSPGSGGLVSGESGAPTRAGPGPTNGIGR